MKSDREKSDTGRNPAHRWPVALRPTLKRSHFKAETHSYKHGNQGVHERIPEHYE